VTGVELAQPLWLGIGALVCVALFLLLGRAERLRRRTSAELAGARAAVTVARGRRVAKRALVLFGTACAFLALARPRWGYRWEAERHTAIDLMFAIDTSKSMLAKDLQPDRLTRAKLAVADLLRELPGERAGLVAFAGTAFVQAPMTFDQAVFLQALDALDAGVIPRGGTNIASAIRTAAAAMASEPDHRKVLVLLSDGEDLDGDALAAATRAARAGLVIDTVGVGTPAGDLVPVDRDGRPGLMRDAAGQPVRSRLDEKTLRGLAAVTGGSYVALGPSGRGLETLYRAHLAALPRHASEERVRKVWTERFQIPLGVAIACLLLDLGLADRRRRRGSGAPAPVGAAAALLLLVGGAPHAAWAARANDRAPQPAPGTATSTYNDGTTAYRRRDFQGAEDRFRSATHTTDLGLQEDAYYDLGNARYRLGQAALAERHDREATKAAWKQALAAYDGALALRPHDEDARFNRDLVARRLAALEKEEQQRQQQRPNQSRAQQQKQSKDQRGGSKNDPGAGAQSGQRGGDQGADWKRQGNGNTGNGSASGEPQPDGQPQGQGQQRGAQPQGQGDQPSDAPARGQGNDHAAGPGQPAGNRQSGAGSDNDASRSPDSGSPRGRGQQPQPAAAQPTPVPDGAGIVSGAATPTKTEGRAASARRAPGALTRGEAIQLLDSLTGELRPPPAASDGRRGSATDAAPEKDW
jgi:Ca-activated chloride channel family protein